MNEEEVMRLVRGLLKLKGPMTSRDIIGELCKGPTENQVRQCLLDLLISERVFLDDERILHLR